MSRRRCFAGLVAAGLVAAGLVVAEPAEHDLLGTHGGEELPHREREAIFDKRIEDAVGVAPLGDQPGAPQHGQMTRDGWPGDREFRRDLACRQFAVFEVLQGLRLATASWRVDAGRGFHTGRICPEPSGRTRRLVAAAFRHGGACAGGRCLTVG